MISLIQHNLFRRIADSSEFPEQWAGIIATSRLRLMKLHYVNNRKAFIKEKI